ncbi:serine hydrolase domain-containing protein [Actinophytocola sediminis]
MTTKLGGWLLATTMVSAMVAAGVPALATPAAAQPLDHPRTQAVLDQYLTHAGPGATVYAGDATGSWTLTSGSATSPATRPIAETDHFRAASQNKSFTATLVLQLVDEGLVVLDEPIERYLPGVVTGNGYDPNLITVRQLLQHTSGVPRDPSNPQVNAEGGYDLAELVRAGLTQAPLFAPGTDFAYSNLGYQILGLLIERVGGLPYHQALVERISEPLGLSETTYPVPGDRTLAEPHPRGYVGSRLGPVFFWVDTTFTLEPSFLGTAGAINSTLPDLSTFQLALAGGDLVSPAALAQMRTTTPHQQDFGLGVMYLDLSCGGRAWGHPGDVTSGFSSVTMVTDDGRFASLVTNAYVTNTTEPTRGNVIDAALCES